MEIPLSQRELGLLRDAAAHQHNLILKRKLRASVRAIWCADLARIIGKLDAAKEG